MPVLRNTDLDPGEWEEVYDAQVLGSRRISMKRIEEITSKHARLALPPGSAQQQAHAFEPT